MKERLIFLTLILLFLCSVNFTAVADIWAISSDGWNDIVRISTKNGKVIADFPAPGIARDLAITKDGAYLYVSFSDLGCGRDTCNGEGLVVFDTRTSANVFQLNDIPDPRRLLIDQSDSILYMLSSLGLQRYDISKLTGGGRANQLMQGWPDLSQPTATSGIDTRQGAIAVSGKANDIYWWVAYCGDQLWVTGLNSCANVGLPTKDGGGAWPPGDFFTNDVMITPDQQNVLTAFSLKVPSLPTIASTFNGIGWDYSWVHDVNLAAFDVQGVDDPSSTSGVAYGFVTSSFAFGDEGVYRLENAGNRFYAITNHDGILYCGDFTGATYPQRQVGIRLSGMAVGDDGKLYVSDAENGLIYPITLGGIPARDRVGKPYVMPARFRPGALVVATPAK